MSVINYDNIAVSERLSEFRKRANWTISDFARLLDVDPSAARRYFNGEANVQSVTYYLFALGCNIIWLYTGRGDMFADNQAGKALRAKTATKAIKEPEVSYNIDGIKTGRSLAEEIAEGVKAALLSVFEKRGIIK